MEGIEAIFRWMHVLAGVLWIGHLYYFNFVNGQMAAKLDGEAKKKVVPELMPRALFWFRWGAAWTWITGFVLLLIVYYHGKAALESETQTFSTGTWVMLGVTLLGVFLYEALYKSGLAKNVKVAGAVAFVLLAVIVYLMSSFGQYSYRGILIHTGTLFGTIMAFNVWFRIWPAQQKIISAIKNGHAPEASLVALAGTRSRHNTYLSVPLLWAMLNQHLTFFSGGNWGIPSDYAWVFWLVVVLIGWHIVYHMYKKAGKVQGF